MSRKACFFMFLLVNVVCNYLWFNYSKDWVILAHQAWAVLCAYGIHYMSNREVVS